jgi:hypothetical protein
MAKKRRALLIVLLLSGALVFRCRYRLVNAIQQSMIGSIRDRAVVDNRRFIRDSTFAHHLVYTLKGMDRIWPHRVNSVRRFRYLYPEFAGFECDIRFIAGKLGIGHDSAGPDLFTEYLKEDAARRKLFWMDIKNVDRRTIGSFCNELETIDRQYSIRNRVIVECYDTLTALAVRSRGFLSGLNISWLGQATDERTTVLRTGYPEKITLLSAEYPLGLPHLRELPGCKQISWDIRFRDSMNRNRLLQLANDTSMLVCLINVKSPGYR